MSASRTPLRAPGRFAQGIASLVLLVFGAGKLASLLTITSGYIVYHEGGALGNFWSAGLGLIEVSLALLLWVGRLRRVVAPIAALLFLGYALGTHRFWEFDIEFQFAQQLLFLKNLLLAAVFLMLGEAASPPQHVSRPGQGL